MVDDALPADARPAAAMRHISRASRRDWSLGSHALHRAAGCQRRTGSQLHRLGRHPFSAASARAGAFWQAAVEPVHRALQPEQNPVAETEPAAGLRRCRPRPLLQRLSAPPHDWRADDRLLRCLRLADLGFRRATLGCGPAGIAGYRATAAARRRAIRRCRWGINGRRGCGSGADAADQSSLLAAETAPAPSSALAYPMRIRC